MPPQAARCACPDLFGARSRTPPDKLNPWFLAGFLMRGSNAHRAGSLGSVSRYDLRRAEVPRVPMEDQERYAALFRQLAEFTALMRTVNADSTDLVSAITYGLAAGELRPA